MASAAAAPGNYSAAADSVARIEEWISLTTSLARMTQQEFNSSGVQLMALGTRLTSLAITALGPIVRLAKGRSYAVSQDVDTMFEHIRQIELALTDLFEVNLHATMHTGLLSARLKPTDQKTVDGLRSLAEKMEAYLLDGSSLGAILPEQSKIDAVRNGIRARIAIDSSGLAPTFSERLSPEKCKALFQATARDTDRGQLYPLGLLLILCRYKIAEPNSLQQGSRAGQFDVQDANMQDANMQDANMQDVMRSIVFTC